MKPSKKIILSVCPCGSGKTVEACHLDVDGNLRKAVPSLLPPKPATDFSHPGCYLQHTRDCSEQISREHYMSKSVLEQLGSSLRVSGMPWLETGQTLETSVGSLTAKILCKRHNEALSPLDQEAALFFSTIRTALIDLERKTLSRKPIFHLVSGAAVELWMLKVACGLFFAIGAKEGVKLAETHTIDMDKVQRAFFGNAWDPRAGLYFSGHTGTVVTVAGDVTMSPLSSDADLRFGGAQVSLLGIALEVLFDTKNTNEGPWTAIVRRPTEIVLRKKRREHHIVLTWPPGTPEASIILGEGRPPGE